jgi:hypothetical protein
VTLGGTDAAKMCFLLVQTLIPKQIAILVGNQDEEPPEALQKERNSNFRGVEMMDLTEF